MEDMLKGMDNLMQCVYFDTKSDVVFPIRKKARLSWNVVVLFEMNIHCLLVLIMDRYDTSCDSDIRDAVFGGFHI